VRRRRQRSALASSSTTTVRRHRRGDRLLGAMDDPFDMSADAMLEDTEDLHIASAVAAHLQALDHWRKRARGSWVSRWPRYVGSVPGRRPNKRRNFRSGLRAILRDYFGLNGEPPVYDGRDFERRFRVPRSVFIRVYNAVKDRPFFAQRINATGRLQAHPLQNVVAAFQVIAYGEASRTGNGRPVRFISLPTARPARSCIILWMVFILGLHFSFLRSPTPRQKSRLHLTVFRKHFEKMWNACMRS